MLKEQEIREQIKKLFLEILNSSGLFPAVREGPYLAAAESRNLDLFFQVETRDQKRYLIVFDIKSAGEPRYARMAAGQLFSFVKNNPDMYGMFGAPYLSEESIAICRQEGIGFLDLAGNCLIRFDTVFIDIQGRANPYPAAKKLKSIFSPKSTRALRALLCNPKKLWFIQGLAEESKISQAQASYLKKRLMEYEFIVETGVTLKKGKQFKLSNPENLLKNWAENYTFRKNKIKNFYSLDDVKLIEKKIVEYCGSNNVLYALSLTSGASFVAPFLRYNRTFAYISRIPEKMVSELGWKEVSTGPNISILEPYDDGVFYGLQDANGTKVVSDIQLYLDLVGYKGRGEEAAQFLLESRLRKQW